MPIRWMETVVVASTALLAACGDGDGGGVDARTGVSLEDSTQAYSEAYCARVFACCAPDELASRFRGADPPIEDEAACVVFVSRAFGNEFVGDVRRAESSGRARYLEDGMAQCLVDLRNGGCDELPRLGSMPASCQGPTEAKVEIDGSCDHNFHCISGYCEGNQPGVDGRCRPIPQIGAPCPDRFCASGLYCDATFVEALCVPQLIDGDSCTSSFECTGGACEARSPTDATMVCGPVTACLGAN